MATEIEDTQFYARRYPCCADWVAFLPTSGPARSSAASIVRGLVQFSLRSGQMRHTRNFLSSLVLQLTQPLLWPGLHQLIAPVRPAPSCPFPEWLALRASWPTPRCEVG